MYSAFCPNCGGIISSPTLGHVLVGCSCGWVGNVVTVAAPGIGGIGGLTFTPPVPPIVSQITEQQPSAEDNRRAHTRQRLYGLASVVTDLLRTLDTEDWDLPLWARYERLQRAHGKLFEALGGARMGDYRPPSTPVEAAVVELLLWELLTLVGAER